MNRFAVAITAITVLFGVLSASALASSAPVQNASPSAVNAGATEYNQKETVPVTNEKGQPKVEGTNAANSGNSGPGTSGSSNGDIASTSSSGSSGVADLPFTGLDVLALAGIGALLVGAGFAQRRIFAGRQA
jgi:hypothetical protein